jgi:sugar/nucleoside kinase (ribokinase family)
MSDSTPAVAVVGNLNLDVKTGPIPADPRLFRDGETSVGEIYEAIGGGGANCALALAQMAQMRGRVHLCAAVGDDALARRLAEFLSRMGVEPRLAKKPAPTGRSIALNWEQHQRHFVSCLPSSLLLEAADVDIEALAAAGCSHLYRADVWFAPRMLEDGNLRLLRQARELGMQTSIDINWDPHWHAGRNHPEVRQRIDAVTRLLPVVTFAHGNQRELCFFSGADTLETAAQWFLDRGCENVIAHLGPGGSAAFSSGKCVRVPAVSVDQIISEAGTGDVFTAAFLQRKGMDLPRRFAESNTAAADHLSGRASWLPRLEALIG